MDPIKNPKNIITILIIAAIICISVIDEINTPIAISAAPYKTKPNIAEYAILYDTVPNLDIIKGYDDITSTGIAKIVSNAKYFPSTTLNNETGAVKIN